LRRFPKLPLLVLLGVGSVWAQDSDTNVDADETQAAQTEVADEDADEDAEDVDNESYADAEEDDFRPSEDIPADQSIPFPTDI
jgi:septal ring-binding cell division protein DamX